MEMEIFNKLGIVFLAAFIFVFLALRLKLPPVVGLLLAGALIGPNMLSLVHTNEIIELFGEFGAILLLFFVGTEFALNKIANSGIKPFIVWFVKDLIVFLLVYEVALLFGLNQLTSLILASALAISSTTFFIKFVGEKNISKLPETRMLFILLIIEDILAVFLLAVYSGIFIEGDYTSLFFSIFRALFVLAITYLALQRIIDYLFNILLAYKSEEIMLFLSLGVAVLMSFFASLIGLTPSIGAFLAGNILSTVKGFSKTQTTLAKFNILFSSFFFISVGMLVDFKVIIENIYIIGVLSLVILFGIFLSIFTSSYLLGFESDRAIRAGLLILAVGEFSLLISRQVRDIVAPFDIVSISSALVFITALVGGILIRYEREVNMLIKALIPASLKESSKKISLYIGSVAKEFEPKGCVYNTFFKEARELLLNVLVGAIIIIGGFAFYPLIKERYLEYELYYIFLIVLIAFLPLIRIFAGVAKVLEVINMASRKAMGENLTLSELAMRELALALLLLTIAVMIPPLTTLLKLPEEFKILYVLPIFISLFYFWNFLNTLKNKIILKK